MKNLVGIVTVLFNSDDVLPGFFKSLANQKDIRFRLYVIDNSKIDSGCRVSRQLADQYGIDMEIIFNNANVGVAKGNNQGIELALRDQCDYVLLSNNDIEFDNDRLIANLVDKLFNSKLSAVVPKIYYYGLGKKIWFAGGEFNRLRATCPHYGDGEDDVGQYDSLIHTEYAPTCFMLIRSDVFSKIGLMDEKYFVYYDDTDFLWRMRECRLKVGFEAKEFILHKVSYSTGGGESEFSIYYGTRNRIYFIKKNYKMMNLIASFAFFYISRVLRAFKYNSKQRSVMWRAIKDGIQLKNLK